MKHYDDAEEITSETFIRCFRSLAGFDRSRPLANWLLGIAHNLVMDYYRKRRIDPVGIEEAAGPPPASPGLEGAYDRKRTIERIEAALARLAPLDREMVILFHKEEKSYVEIGAILALPVTTVKTRLHRARKKLAGMVRPATEKFI